MTAPSPAAQESALLGFEITSNGQAIDSSFQVVSIDTWSTVNKIPRARIVLIDGSPADGTFPISSGSTFVPGNTIVISAGYGGDLKPIFEGIVIAQNIDINRTASPTLGVELADKAIKMTVSRNSAVFEKKKDSDVLRELIGAGGLSADISATNAVLPAMVQFGASDWDIVLFRADVNGMIVTTEAGKVTVKAPDTSTTPVLHVAFGESVLDLHAELDAVSQLSNNAVKSYAWDMSTQARIDAAAGSVSLKEPGNLSGSTLAGVCAANSYPQMTGGFLTKDDLQTWSTARLLRSRLAKIRGRVRFQGSALAKPGVMIELDGVGDRFNGAVFVSAVHHDLRSNVWLTTVEFGLASDWFGTQPAAHASGTNHLADVKGLQTGVVKQLDSDPDGEFRVLVTFPVAGDNVGVWARLGSAYASNQVGSVFYPEIGDEVILAFMNEDPRFPVILGSVYSKKLPPPKTPDKENQTKAFVTRSKMELSFDEKDKIIVLKTPGNHVITISDKDKAITLVDSQKNSVTLNDKGMILESKSNLTLKASGNIEITATGNLSMKATGNATLEGMQVDVKAQTAFSAQGQASAELKSSGVLTVQGSLVKIN